MRPVTRGPAPPRPFARYQDAIGGLEKNLGRYCSYCEKFVSPGLAVEHVVPKSRAPAMEKSWDNFLLGCTNCNSNKGAKPTNETDFLWPDRDNTLRAFAYLKGGFVEVAPGLTPDNARRARKLMELVGLQRHIGLPTAQPAGRDARWLDRDEIWRAAELLRGHYGALSGRARVAVLEAIVLLLQSRGFFSIWMTVFAGVPKVRQALIDALPGTASDCFDRTGRAVPRPGRRV